MPQTPIMGVDLDRYAEVHALVPPRLRSDPDQSVRIAATLGIDRATWRLADAGWSARLATDAVLQTEFGRLIAQRFETLQAPESGP